MTAKPGRTDWKRDSRSVAGYASLAGRSVAGAAGAAVTGIAGLATDAWSLATSW